MENASQKYIKQLTSLSTLLHLQLGFYLGILHSECGWGWPVTDDLDLGWIHMYAMLINDVA
jgi:hypothetical protein